MFEIAKSCLFSFAVKAMNLNYRFIANVKYLFLAISHLSKMLKSASFELICIVCPLVFKVSFRSVLYDTCMWHIYKLQISLGIAEDKEVSIFSKETKFSLYLNLLSLTHTYISHHSPLN